MNTPQTPDYGEPWTLMSTGAVHDRNDNLVTEDSAKLRMLSCVNDCAGMADPAKEIEAMREAIKEAHGALQMVVLETLKQWDSTKPLPCVGTIENAANVALAKLKPFIKP